MCGPGNIVGNDLFLLGNGRLLRCKQGASPTHRDPHVEEGNFSCERDRKAFASLCRMGQFRRMVEEVGFPRRKRGEHGRAGKSAPGRPLRRVNDSSHGTVTREALDVVRYITDMTAQLEAMAIAGRLDLLAYFLGMAKAESEIYVRTNAVVEAERTDQQLHEPTYELPQESSSFD
jgi:hypothetical protein